VYISIVLQLQAGASLSAVARINRIKWDSSPRIPREHTFYLFFSMEIRVTFVPLSSFPTLSLISRPSQPSRRRHDLILQRGDLSVYPLFGAQLEVLDFIPCIFILATIYVDIKQKYTVVAINTMNTSNDRVTGTP
jgi:hypothetical protein